MYPYKDKIRCPHSLRDEKLAPMPRTEHAIKVNRQEYYAIITHMDVQIGRILDSLEESGLADSTYVFYSADHGLGVGHHGLLGKQNLYEHSTRVPFIVQGPGIPKGKQIEAPIYLQDVMPTRPLPDWTNRSTLNFKTFSPWPAETQKNPPTRKYTGLT